MTNSDTELSDFTKLVLARLETNPDEFQLGGRWDTLVRGIEAYVRGDQEDRYYRTLWPLDDPEVRLIVAAYRKAYLARLHKDMLKNIVSGNDLGPSVEQTYQAGIGKSSQVLTTSAMKQQTLATLNSAFDGMYANAPVKQEGMAVDPNTLTYKASDRYGFAGSDVTTATIQLGDTKLTEGDVKKLKKILVTHTDHAMAKKMGMDVFEYIKRRDGK
jgi:hypothetical protein